ncbi:MAG: hypothetical protein A4S09_13875 [Proteobacteria bacterium SG_bin7]|nr:MAG: hypothetical protein A4S09_13875 [Proteobacteria bacterium SG_bin7]
MNKIWTRQESKERFPQAISPLGWSILATPTEAALKGVENAFGLKNINRNRVVRRIDGYIYTAKGFFSNKKNWEFHFVALVKLVLVALFCVFRELICIDRFSFRYRFERRFFSILFEKSLFHLIKSWEATKSGLIAKMSANYNGDLEKHRLDGAQFFSQDFTVYFFKNFVGRLLKQGLKDLGIESPSEVLKKLSSGHARNFSSQMALDFADERLSYEELMNRYGHLTDNWDIYAPTLRELSKLPRDFSRFERIHQDLKLRQQERILETEKILKSCRSNKNFVQLILYFEELLLIDEELRAFSSLQYPELKKIFRNLEKKFGLASNDIYFLTIEEIQSGHISLQTIKKRRSEYRAACAISPPFELREEANGKYSAVEDKSTKAHLTGEGASAGIAKGRALIVETINDIRRMEADSILVIRSPTPTYAAYYSFCRGIVSETGGSLSHGAIVAREFGIPMVSDVNDALMHIRDGDEIEVNGNEGVVKNYAELR